MFILPLSFKTRKQGSRKQRGISWLCFGFVWVVREQRLGLGLELRSGLGLGLGLGSGLGLGLGLGLGSG